MQMLFYCGKKEDQKFIAFYQKAAMLQWSTIQDTQERNLNYKIIDKYFERILLYAENYEDFVIPIFGFSIHQHIQVNTLRNYHRMRWTSIPNPRHKLKRVLWAKNHMQKEGWAAMYYVNDGKKFQKDGFDSW